ncbi:MAG TPA: spore coat protein U domain-containing protein [Zeimonas sp.]|nr:spore coat protein U domain-containing protein [Zeimonas sp.]
MLIDFRGDTRLMFRSRRQLRRHVGPLALVLVAALPAGARAQGDANLGVSATVVDSCRFAEAPDATLDESGLAPGADGGAAWTVRFQCTRTTPYVVDADPGQHYDAGAQTRRMQAAGTDDAIAYALVLTPEAGEGRGASLITATVAAAVQPVEHGVAPARAYTDVVVLTVRDKRSGKALASAPVSLRYRAGTRRARARIQ